MILRVSQRLAQRINCPVSQTKEPILSSAPLQAWNGDVLTVAGIGSFALVSEESTLFSLLVPLKGIRSYEAFLSRLLPRLEAVAKEVGKPSLFQNAPILFTKRTDRRIIGSQSELMCLCGAYFEDALGPWNETALPNLESWLNKTPMSLIGMESPARELQRIKTG